MTDFNILKRLTRANFRTIKFLKEICGYYVSKILVSEISGIFDYLCESPYSNEKDTGILLKVTVDDIDESLLQAIRGFKTQRKKELWLYTKEKLLIFKFEGAELVWPRDEKLLKEHLKSKSRNKTPSKVSQKDKNMS